MSRNIWYSYANMITIFHRFDDFDIFGLQPVGSPKGLNCNLLARALCTFPAPISDLVYNSHAARCCSMMTQLMLLRMGMGKQDKICFMSGPDPNFPCPRRECDRMHSLPVTHAQLENPMACALYIVSIVAHTRHLFVWMLCFSYHELIWIFSFICITSSADMHYSQAYPCNLIRYCWISRYIGVIINYVGRNLTFIASRMISMHRNLKLFLN